MRRRFEVPILPLQEVDRQLQALLVLRTFALNLLVDLLLFGRQLVLGLSLKVLLLLLQVLDRLLQRSLLL